MSTPHQRTRDICVGCMIASALVLGLVWVLPAPDTACAQATIYWTQLNAWSSQALLRPFALLLRGC